MTKKTTAEDINDTFAHFEGENDTSGYEDINMDTTAVPFIRLLQDLSAQLKKSKPEFIPEATAGQFFNTANERLYGESIKVVVGKFERYYIEWKANRGPFVQTHSIEHVEANLLHKLMRDEKNKLYNPDTGNNFVETYIYYVLMPDFMEDGVCIVSMSSSAIKAAKKLNRNLTSTIIPGTKRKALPYFMVWNMSVADQSNDQGDWYGYKFSFDSFVTPDLLDGVVDERKALPEKTIDFNQLEDRSEGAKQIEGPTTKF